jgi:hypothetical protein
MRRAFLAAGILASLLGVGAASAQEKPQAADAPVPPSSQAHIAYLDKSKIIYISDFDSATGAPGIRSGVAPNGSDSIAASGSNRTASAPANAAPPAAKLMSDALLHGLKKRGYKVKILAAGDAQPEDGMLLTGVFAESGKDGRMRRANVSAGEINGDVVVFASTTNLYHVAKPLYAVTPADDSITLNPEVAVLRFALGKDLGDKAIKKAADQIVAELERLTLEAQAEGLGGSGDPLNKFSKP